jgi:phosphatidylglycerophosphate synthase
MFWVFMTMLMVTVFRELAVASIRLITAKKSGIVVAADMLGKIKTVVQIACIELALLEPLVYDYVLARIDPTYGLGGFYVLTLLAAAAAIVFTVWSGANYIASYWKYMDPEK